MQDCLVLEIIQGKTTVAEASRSFDLPPSEVKDLVDDAKRGMENALLVKHLEIKELQEAFGEDMLELRARKKLQSLLGEDEKRSNPSSRDYRRTGLMCQSLTSATGLMFLGGCFIASPSRKH